MKVVSAVMKLVARKQAATHTFTHTNTHAQGLIKYFEL